MVASAKDTRLFLLATALLLVAKVTLTTLINRLGLGQRPEQGPELSPPVPQVVRPLPKERGGLGVLPHGAPIIAMPPKGAPGAQRHSARPGSPGNGESWPITKEVCPATDDISLGDRGTIRRVWEPHCKSDVFTGPVREPTLGFFSQVSPLPVMTHANDWQGVCLDVTDSDCSNTSFCAASMSDLCPTTYTTTSSPAQELVGVTATLSILPGADSIGQASVPALPYVAIAISTWKVLMDRLEINPKAQEKELRLVIRAICIGFPTMGDIGHGCFRATQQSSYVSDSRHIEQVHSC